MRLGAAGGQGGRAEDGGEKGQGPLHSGDDREGVDWALRRAWWGTVAVRLAICSAGD